MKKFKDFYESWWFLNEHPMFINWEDVKDLEIDSEWCNDFLSCLYIYIPKVNPKSKRICKKDELNTLTQVWLECGGIEWDDNFNGYIKCHDIRLDCGADTFEEAIVKLANLVMKYYGDGKNKLFKQNLEFNKSDKSWEEINS